MTKISILAIFLAKLDIDTKRLWQKSSEKIAKFLLLLLLKGIYDGYSNDSRQKRNRLQNNNFAHALQDYHVKMPIFKFNEERTHSSSYSEPGWDIRLKGIGFYEFHSRRVRPYLTCKRV